MSKYSEVRNNFYDDIQKKVCIDAWKSDDDNEEGRVIAKIDVETKEVEYIDMDAKSDPYAQEKIRESLSLL